MGYCICLLSRITGRVIKNLQEVGVENEALELAIKRFASVLCFAGGICDSY